MQLLRFTKHPSKTAIWINPEHMIFAETFEKLEGKETIKGTILHVSGKEGKVFIRESPEEINKIVRSIKKEITIQM